MIRHTRLAVCAITLVVCLAGAARGQTVAPAAREIFDGIATTRVVQGAPYELAGNRVVFTNWYYIQPGDVAWVDSQGKYLDYTTANTPLLEARHVGVSAPHGIRISAEKPHVVGPLSRPGRMTLRDGNVYKAWTARDYFESPDAIHWEKRAALTLDAPISDGIHHVFIDRDAPSDERYKAVWVGTINRARFDALRAKRPDCWEPRAIFALGERDEITCLRGSVSPDGIHWTTLPDPLVVEYCDTLNTAYYDRALREYVIYTRYWSVGPCAGTGRPDIRNNWTGVGRRAIGRTASSDFRQFKPSEMILEPTPDMLPSEQLYTNCHTTIPGAPDQHLMFPAIWNASVDDTTRLAMAASHDCKLWHWVPGGDLLHTGPFGRWDGGCVWLTPDLVELPNGDWALPYIGHNVPHKYPRGQRSGGEGYAVWPKGRLVALEADDHGEFTMMTVIPPGKKLRVNALTQRTGWIKIEALGLAGHGMADCKAIVGDQHWAEVTWKNAGDLGIEKDQPVTLRLEMKQAKLYGLQFD